MEQNETRTEAELRQIKWLLAGILVCLAVIVLAMLPTIIGLLLRVIGIVIIVGGFAGMVWAAWLLASYLIDHTPWRSRRNDRASVE